MTCKNCKADPSIDSTVHLRRINDFGLKGEWICTDCLESCETFNGKLHYFHSKDCPSYCDYACNGNNGFDLAEQVEKGLKP